MRVSFTKMHGLGNDFIVLDAREQSLPPIGAAMASALAHRRTGIGCDQLIVLEPSEQADFRMRIFNADGSEVEACGNASRAVALLYGEPATIETAGGLISARPVQSGIAVDMGEPSFGWEDIPLAYAMDTLTMPVSWDDLPPPSAVNVGNPHVVLFLGDGDQPDPAQLGPQIESDPLFPKRINVNFARITGDDQIALTVWERGAGLTRACGTGACATAVSAMRRGLTGREVAVTLPGGVLNIGWGDDQRITMTGPAAESFRGSFDWGDYG